MTDKLSVGSTLSGERAVSIEVTQQDREAAEPFRRGKGGKYDRDQEALARAFALHAAPLREALKPFAALPLSTEGEVSDCVLRTPAAEARRHADAIESRDAQILAARSALSPSYPMENYNGE